jgi:hypothetical protein
MAVQDATARARISAQLQRDMRDTGGFWNNLTKADLLAAVNAADDWRNTNATAYNTALPDPFKTNATAAQKSMLLCYVIMRFYGNLHVDEDG